MCLLAVGTSCAQQLTSFPSPEPSKYPPHMQLEIIGLVVLAVLGIGLFIWYFRLAGKKRLVVFAIALLCLVAAAVGVVRLPEQIDTWQADHPYFGGL